MKQKIGNTSVEIEEDIKDIFLASLDKIIPNAKKIMEDKLAEIQDAAVLNWPVRKPIIRKDNNGKIIFFKKISKGSVSKFEQGFATDAQGKLIVYLRNNAPYSWAIKIGQDSVNMMGDHITLPLGTRVANELIVKPWRKSVNDVVKALSDDLKRHM